MVRVHVLRGVLASGEALVAGSVADISDTDASVLVRMGKVRLLPPEPMVVDSFPEPETEEAPMRETATRSRRRRATLQ